MNTTKISKFVIVAAIAMTAAACTVKRTDYRMVYDSTGFTPSSLKKGEACVEKGMFGWAGDATIGAAAKNGSISNVKYVEQTSESKKRCTVVYGK